MPFADLPPGRHADSVHNHWWWRPGWKVGRQFFTWHLTFEEADTLHQLVATYQRALAGLPGVHPVPTEWLHLTMQGIGFVDQVSSDELADILNRGRLNLARIGPLRLTFCDAFVGDEAIVIPPREESAVREVRSTIRSAIGAVWGDENIPEDANRFRPHVSVAYLGNEGPSAPYVEAVESTTPESVTVTVNEVSLIALNRDHQMYQWQTYATAPLS